jgi:hypothetical protein
VLRRIDRFHPGFHHVKIVERIADPSVGNSASTLQVISDIAPIQIGGGVVMVPVIVTQ